MGLAAIQNGNVPMGGYPSTEDARTGDAARDAVTTRYDLVLSDMGEAGDVEKQIANFVESGYDTCKNKSLTRRKAFDKMLADMYGDIPMNDNTGMGNQVTPIVGNSARTMARLVGSRLIPDRELMNFFTPGYDFGQAPDTVDPEQMKRMLRDSVIAERFVQQCLRLGRFDESMDRILPLIYATGNGVASWEWRQEWTCELPDEDDGPEMDGGDPGTTTIPMDSPWQTEGYELAGMGEAEQSGTEDFGGMGDDAFPDEDGDPEMDGASPIPEDDGPGSIEEYPVLVRQYPVLVVKDLRNWMPSSLYCAEGGDHLEWYCEYDTTNWRHLRQNRVRPKSGYGCYANTELFTYEGEGNIYPIADDMWSIRAQPGVLYAGGYFTQNQWYDRGYKIKRRVGPLNVEEVYGNLGAAPKRSAWNKALKKFNPDYKDRMEELNYVKFWLMETIDGVLVRCQPYPYYKGRLNPIEHFRYMVDEGFTYGRGMYANGVSNLQTAANFLDHLEMGAAEKCLRPPIVACEDELDPAWVQQNQGGVYNNPPGKIIYTTIGVNKANIIHELKPDPSAMQQVRESRAGVESRLEASTTVNKAVQGSGDSRGTATQSIQDRNFSMAPIEHEVYKMSRSIARMLEKLGLIIDEYATESIGVLVDSSSKREQLASYDDEIAAQIAGINAGIGTEIAGIGALYVTMENSGFFGQMAVTMMGPMMGGGPAARVQSLSQWLEIAMTVEAVSPGIVNYKEILIQVARSMDLPNPEMLLNDSGAQQAQTAFNAELKGMEGLAQAEMGLGGGAGGGASGGAGKGKPSPPAPKGSAIPQGAMA